MATGGRAADAALVAWADACRLGGVPIDRLEDLAGKPMLQLARHFVQDAARQLPEAGGLGGCGKEIAEHVNEVYRSQSSEATRIVDVRWAAKGDARACRALLLGILLAAFQGPRAQEAAAHVAGLRAEHQEALAEAMQATLAQADCSPATGSQRVSIHDAAPADGFGVLASSGSATGASSSSAPSAWRRVEERRDSHTSSMDSPGVHMSPNSVEALLAEMAEKRALLNTERSASLQLVREIYSAKESLHYEADLCSELHDEFEGREQGALLMEDSVQRLREEVQEESQVASKLAKKQKVIRQRTEELQRERLALQSECAQLREQLAPAQKPKVGWTSAVDLSKLKRLQEGQEWCNIRLKEVAAVTLEESNQMEAFRSSFASASEQREEQEREATEARRRLSATEARMSEAEAQEERHRQNIVRLVGGTADDLLSEVAARRNEEQEAHSQIGHAVARLGTLETEERRERAELEELRNRPLPELARADYAPSDTAAGELRAALADAEAEARGLQDEVAAAERQLAEASRAASAGVSSASGTPAAFASTGHVQRLQAQIQLRIAELNHRHRLSTEAKAAHEREMRLLSSALHRVGLRWSRLHDRCRDLQEAHTLALQTGADAAWLPQEQRRSVTEGVTGLFSALWG